MNKQKILTALKIIETEIQSDNNLSRDMAIYQIYCELNSFIANWVKTRIKEDLDKGIPVDDPERQILKELSNSLISVMCKYSETVKAREAEHANRSETTDN